MFILTLYPYVYLLARAAFLAQSVCMLEVSRTLGQNGWNTFRKVALPLARPALVMGMMLAVMETLADFGTVAHFGVQTFTTGIYRALYSYSDPTAAAQLATGLLGLVLLLFWLEYLSRGNRQFHNVRSLYHPLSGYELHGFKAFFASFACIIPLLFGFLLPIGLLLQLAAAEGHDPFSHSYFVLARHSVILAAIGALCAVLLALLLAYAKRLSFSLLTTFAIRTAALGYAIPGSVIAIGLIIAFGRFDAWLDQELQRYFDFSSGLILTGTIVALIFAYLVRFMAVALQTVEAGLVKVSHFMDDAARCLGASPLAILHYIHRPIISGSLFTAILIVFVDIMKELPATLILRPFNFDTLAIRAYQLASDERLGAASTASLIIVLVGILPVLLLSRQIVRTRPGSKAHITT